MRRRQWRHLDFAYLQHCHMVAVKQSSRELHRHHFNGVWYNKNRGSTCQSYKQFNHRRVKCERRSQEQHIILCDLKYGSKIRKLWMTKLMHTVKNPFPTERMKVWKKCISKAQILRALNIQTGNVSKSSQTVTVDFTNDVFSEDTHHITHQ